MSTHDDYADWDAAYVLGALPVGRAPRVRGRTSPGAPPAAPPSPSWPGMPGLLAQLPPGEVLAMDLDGASAHSERNRRPR